MGKGALAPLILIAWLSGCARAVRPDAPLTSSHGLGEGWASFYAAELKGQKTASGERFDPAGFTAAHRTLPFGSCVEVESVRTGRRARVRVNDRGPYAKHRILDVSLAAARKLGTVKDGVFRVRLHGCR